MFLKELTSSKYAETTVLAGLLSTVAKAGESNGTNSEERSFGTQIHADTHRYTQIHRTQMTAQSLLVELLSSCATEAIEEIILSDSCGDEVAAQGNPTTRSRVGSADPPAPEHTKHRRDESKS
jgi:hypothetical protein